MKKLIVALFASATALFASAKVLTQEGFEEGLGGFTGTGGTLVSYASDYPQECPYPFSSAGDSYCDIDADGETFDSPSSSAAYFDMNVKFTVRDSVNEGDLDGAKLAVYLNSASNIVVRSGSGEYETGLEVDSSGWARLTIAKVTGGFKVYVDGGVVQENDEDKVFAPINDVGDTLQVAFDGKGALDNFVARTTDPFYSEDYVASVGTGDDNEKYATYSAALADVLSSGATAAITVTVPGETPKTMNGTDQSPYEIPDLASLKEFQAAIAATNGNDKSYALTADIALDAPWPGIGIQNGKDLVSYDVSKIGQTEADRRDDAFETCAFKGTFDGRNHTISGFQIIGKGSNAEGLDYAGFFNSTRGATIQNLKIQYAGSLFAADTTASTKESGATFVGVAKGSTLRNLTTIAGTVSCSKGFGGIVGYLMGTTVDSCTNNVNMTSLANNKCGGIAMICQKAGCSISNCENNGTMTTDSVEHGGIVGYTDDIAISDCNNTAACKMFYHHGGTVALSGENKGSATVASYTGVATPGLNFATVDGNVATFVSDDALTAGKTYKVMSAQAAATYNFDAAGTIAFDTAVATPASTNITAVASLGVAGPKVVGSVSTYSAGVAAVDDIAYATFADAVDALDGATDDYVTLLADAEVTLNVGDTLRVKTDNHELAVYKSLDVIVISNADEYDITTLRAVACVATFNNNKFPSLSSAIEAAAEATGDDKTVKLLSNISLDARVEPNLGSGKSLTIDLGGKTITRTGTSGNGSVFDVKSGNVVITNGVIDCTQDDAAIVAGGVYAITARSGANVTLGGLTVTVRSQAGACVYPFAGAHVTILSGTYANTTQNDYQYKAGWRGMAVNQANVASQLIAISGGSFKQVNPALGDDSWASAGNGFLASGYAATWNPSTGYYEVAEYVPPSGIDAGQSQTVEVDPTGKTEEQQKAEAEAAVGLAVTIPGDVSTKIENAGKTLDQATYQSYFKKVVTPGTGADEGKWVVTAELDETKVFTATESEEAATEQSILNAALGEESTAATVRAAKPGLYYSMEASNDIGFAAGKGTLEGDRTLATGTTVDIEKPNTPSGNAVFFRVKVSRTDK